MAVDYTDALHQLSVTELSDALDRCGIRGQCARILPIYPDIRVFGPAFTVSYRPVGTRGGDVGDYLDDVPAEAVVAIDNRGRIDATVWGDLLTVTAHRRGIAGTIIDGACRDTARGHELGYPVFARGHWMRTGKDRVAVQSTDTPITLGDVLVEPEDLLVGDADGVVAIPRDRTAEVIETAVEIHDAEERIRQLLERGASLRQARRDEHYHTLQTRRSDSTPIGDRQ